jgi:DNA polymerase, archaea type
MDTLLFGTDPDENIVAAFQISDKNIRVYKKINKNVAFEDKEFYPFFFLTESRYIDDFHKKFWIKKMNGPNHFKYVCAFHNWAEMKEAYHFIIDKYKKENKGEVKDFNEVLIKNDPVGQYLTQYGKTLFKKMNFKDLYRIQFDIFLKKSDSSDKNEIFAIYLADNEKWECYIDGNEKTEKQKIEEFIKIITDKDPDIIEGYNLYYHSLNVLLEKSREYNIPLKIGRNGLDVKFIERIGITEYEFEKPVLVVPGRHIIDIQDLVQNYDQVKRLLDSYSLENIAKATNCYNEERFNLKSKDSKGSDLKPEEIKKYLIDNCREIRCISESLLPGIFYLSQMVPYNLGRVVKLSHFQKIESILIREYLKERQAIPRPEKVEGLHGGTSDIFFTGVLGPIVHAEIDLLYPLIMIKNNIFPKSDTQGLIKKIMEKFLQAFNELQAAKEKEENKEIKEYNENILNILRPFLNSFFGYINSQKTIFNSSETLRTVLGLSREVSDKIITIIKNSGGICISIDPEEMYFIPPRDVINEEMELNYVNNLGKKLTETAIVRYRDRYRRILSYKKKNFALLGYNSKIKIKGSALISKNIERFGRRFILQCIDFLINHRIEEIHKLYNKYYKEISEQKWDIIEFQRTETLRETLKEYEHSVSQGKNKSPYYQLAIASGKNFKPGDNISFYIINNEAEAKRNKIDYDTVNLVKSISDDGKSRLPEKRNPYEGCENYKLTEEWNPNFRDENIEYYFQRLDEISQKFQIFFTPEDFRMIFSPDDLFVYSSSNIKIQIREYPFEEKEEAQKELLSQQ